MPNDWTFDTVLCQKCRHPVSAHSDNHGDYSDCIGKPRNGFQCHCQKSQVEILLDALNAASRAERGENKPALAMLPDGHLLTRESTDQELMAWLTGVADACEGERGNDAWNLHFAAERIGLLVENVQVLTGAKGRAERGDEDTHD